MSKEMDEFKEWCEKLSDFNVGKWEEWPDINLYMDQVISYLDKYMSYFRIYDDEKMITPSIINNNTKDGVLPKPVKKKYSRTLLSTLLMFCITRQVLSGRELYTMLGELTESEDFAEIHKSFGDTLEQQLKNTLEQIEADTNNFEIDDRQQLAWIAMKLSLEAFSSGIMARKLLSELEIPDEQKVK